MAPVDDLFELLIWLLILTFGWLWSSARGQRVSRRRPAAARTGEVTAGRPAGAERQRRTGAVRDRQPLAGRRPPPFEAPLGEPLEGRGAGREGPRPEGVPILRSTGAGLFTGDVAERGPTVAGPFAGLSGGDLVRAIVTAEVLGPPRGRRPYRWAGAAGTFRRTR
ncbi:MAG: hypothetical protein AB1609_05090 [Bacillota bacterium]